jgi:hypothetical protein
MCVIIAARGLSTASLLCLVCTFSIAVICVIIAAQFYYITAALIGLSTASLLRLLCTFGIVVICVGL